MDTRKSIRRLTLGTLTLVCAACLIGNAQAQSAEARFAHKVTVKYGDVNLSTESGARTLYRRIRGAARSVCGEEGRSIDEQRMWARCVRNSMDEAVATVHSPLVTAIYKNENAKPQVTAMLAE